ncbi:MAG: hypothetical protein PUG48_02980 [Clostridia bacterium]|nr:hypothetical protein [Clostridia bacterium]
MSIIEILTLILVLIEIVKLGNNNNRPTLPTGRLFLKVTNNGGGEPLSR